MRDDNKTVSTLYKWNDFETVYIKYIEESSKEIYSSSINENEAALIILTNDDIITLSRYSKDETHDTLVVDDIVHKFEKMRDCLKYLRSIQLDHAVDYDYKNLVRKLISKLYLNDLIKPEDII